MSIELDPPLAPQIREALDAIALADAEVTRVHQAYYYGDKDSWRITIPADPKRDSDLIIGNALTLARSALLGEAPPKASEAEHPSPNSSPGATVQPQARPMKLRAKTEGAGYFGSVQVEVYENEKWISCHNAKTDGVWKEIADRLNFFEPPHQGEAT